LNGHYLLGEAGIILAAPDGHIHLSNLDARTQAPELTRSLKARLDSLMVEQVYGRPPSAVQVLNFTQQQRLDDTRIYPNGRFQDSSRKIFGHLLGLMGTGGAYPNSLGCSQCPVKSTCLLP
jgi:hypothetical protein